MHTTSGPALERKVDVAGLLTNLQEGDVLFVDEIHRLNAAVEEVLYPAMEDYEIDIMIGEGPAARSIRMQVPPFTLIGATTRTGLLTTPLRDRFGVWQRLEYYDDDELAAIVRRSAGILGVRDRRRLGARDRRLARAARRASPTGCCAACATSPRCATRASSTTTSASPRWSSSRSTREGLDKLDRDILLTIAEKFDGGPVGLDTLAVALGEEADTLMDVYEPYLIMQGFLKRTPRGRVLTRTGFRHCGLKPPRTALDTPLRRALSAAPASRRTARAILARWTDLLLHTCCGPCSTVAVPAWRERGVEPVAWFANPNIQPAAEQERRRESMRRFSRAAGLELVVERGRGERRPAGRRGGTACPAAAPEAALRRLPRPAPGRRRRRRRATSASRASRRRSR